MAKSKAFVRNIEVAQRSAYSFSLILEIDLIPNCPRRLTDSLKNMENQQSNSKQFVLTILEAIEYELKDEETILEDR